MWDYVFIYIYTCIYIWYVVVFSECFTGSLKKIANRQGHCKKPCPDGATPLWIRSAPAHEPLSPLNQGTWWFWEPGTPDQRISGNLSRTLSSQNGDVAERENSMSEVGFPWIWTLGFDPAKSRFKFIDHMGVSFLWGPQIIHFSRIFHYEPSSYWGIPISGGPHHFSHKNSAVSWGDSPETPGSCSHWDPWVFAPDIAPTCLT